MRNDACLSLLMVGVCVAGCDIAGVPGSGNVVSETRPVSGFSSVDLSGAGEVIVDRNGTESLTVSADDNLLPYLTTDVRGGVLTLGTKPGTNVNPSKRIVYKLTAKDLDGLSVSGSGSVEATGIKSARLLVDVSGAGQLHVSGSADQQDIAISGSGDYRAPDLDSKVATISISGSGNAALTVSDKLDANISGSGSVEYTGGAIVTQHISGSGSIRKR
jgi:putative autotransporter adhesin-like protein